MPSDSAGVGVGTGSYTAKTPVFVITYVDLVIIQDASL